MMDREELRQAAGSYIAGDLEADERAAFEGLLDHDGDLAEEVAFWERMRTALPTHGRPPATVPEPGPGMLAVVHQRAAAEAEREARGPAAGHLVPWTGWLLAAAAVVALAVLLARGYGGFAAGATAFNEFGDELVTPRHPLAAEARFVMQSEPPPVSAHAGGSHDEEFRPWLGVWTRPINIVHEEIEADNALQVVRVVEDGPAHRAGLLPGDVLLAFGGCPTFSQLCIIKAITEGDFAGGDRVPVRYWRPLDDRQVATHIILARVIE